MVSNMLRMSEEQYSVKYDDVLKLWRILDLQHSQLAMQGMDVDSDISDDHPAMTILTESAFISLIKAAVELEKVKNIDVEDKKQVQEEYDRLQRVKTAVDLQLIETIGNLDNAERTIDELKRKLGEKPKYSEGFALKEKVVDSLLKIVAVQEVGDINE